MFPSLLRKITTLHLLQSNSITISLDEGAVCPFPQSH